MDRVVAQLLAEIDGVQTGGGGAFLSKPYSTPQERKLLPCQSSPYRTAYAQVEFDLAVLRLKSGPV